MGESTARIGIYADDKASPVVKSVQGSLQKLGTDAKSSILTGIGLGAGVTAFQALGRAVHEVTDFVGDSVQAAMDEESSIASLTAALKANVAGYDGNNAAIEKVLTARIRLGYADDVQRASLAALVAMTKDSTAALEIQGIAMDAAAITGKDFESISIALGKAFTGNTAALKKLGIVVDSGATGYELLAAVQQRFAGGAEAASNTTQGALKGMGAEFDELKEDIGKQFLPIITDLARFARDKLVPALRDAVPVMKNIAGVVGELAKVALPLLVLWMGTKLVAALKAAGAAANSTAGALGLIVAGGMAIGNESKTFIQQQMQQTLAMRQGADAAKVFGDALIETGGDTGKAMDAVNTYLRRGLAEGTASMADGMKQIRGVMETHRGEVVVSATRSLHDPIFDAINQASLDAQAEAAKIPKETGDAMLARQQDLADATTNLIAFMAKAMSPAKQRADALGFLQSDAYATGMKRGANDPAVLAKTIEARDLALRVLFETSPASDGGKNLGKAWMDGIIAGIKARQSTLSISVSKMKAILYGNSPPKEGPLKDIDKGGFNIGRSWLDAFNKGLGGGVRVPSLPGMSGGGGAMAAATAGISGGREVHIHIDQGAFIDGPSVDRLANLIAQRLRYAPGI